MKFFKHSSLALAILLASAIPAMASITVYSPSNNAQVSTQFTLNAVSASCSNQPVSAMGFSLDSSSNTTVVHSTSIDATVSASSGSHTLHVKAWGNAGAACVTDVAVTVSTSASTTGGITVSSPGNNASVSSPFQLSATAPTCSSQPVSAMGYSIDSGSTTIVHATSINTNVSSSSGAHTLHVKAWGNSGASCMTNVPINVGTATTSTSSTTSSPSSSTSGTTIQGITVSSPGNNATVYSPFVLNAAATYCSSQAVSAMGYSLDSSSSTAIVKSTSVSASITAAAGAHTLHVKSWGNGGSSCVANIAINVASGTGSTTTTSSGSTSTTSSSGVTISSPLNGASVGSPFTVSGNAPTCSSQTVTAIGYSLDSGATTIVNGTSINEQASASSGSHTLHLKAWNGSGTVCTASETINVTGSSTGSGGTSSTASSVVPSYATTVSSIQALSGWVAQNDPATGGSSSGWMSLVNSPSLSGNSRQFNSSFTNSSGEIYHVTFGDDTSATNFFYDGWVYIANSNSNIANIEMDMNQVMPNGQTAIYGFQCDGYSGTWDYTKNAGSPTSPNDTWVHSGASCNPRNWSVNTWHHVQISYSRNSSGYVTYHSVWLDGHESQINATVPSAFALGWGPVLLTNFQVDGRGSGSNTVYLDKLTVSRW